MARQREQRLFATDKIEWLLGGGLDALGPAERQLLLAMAETTIQEGYRPTREERAVLQRLHDLGGADYDAAEIRRKVRAMVQMRSRPDAAPLKLPPVFDRLIGRFRSPGRAAEDEREP
ncbi:MAG: hypothetical protein JXA09_00800 [Anaerolineae bacterium]|nr:hypothetical protein [Anaerolineae bacterium]